MLNYVQYIGNSLDAGIFLDRMMSYMMFDV